MLIELHARDFQPIVILWRPFHRNLVRFRKSWNPNASLVQAFANLFYISYTKLFFLVYIPFDGIDFVNEKGNSLNKFKATYIDPTIPYLHHKHIYLMVFSACLLVFIVISPILILTVYSTRLCNRLRNRLPPRLNLALLTFVDTYQGCFKDGTNGTRDYRALSGAFLALCVLILAVSTSRHVLALVNERSPGIGHQIGIIAFILLSVAFAVIRPYKSDIANHSGVCFSALYAVGSAILMSKGTAAVSEKGIIVTGCVLLSLPHIVFYGYVVYRLGKFLRQSDINFKATLKLLCFKEWRKQNEEGSALLNRANNMYSV